MTFRLAPAWVREQVQHGPAPRFGFNGLGECVFNRSYARLKPNGNKESFHDVVLRVVEGTFRMQQRHCESLKLPWDSERAQREARDMYQRIVLMKFLPPGRGLWAMGTAITEKLHQYASLMNCAYVSTALRPGKAPSRPFVFLMDALMHGTGVGFGVEGADEIFVEHGEGETLEWAVPDTRTGWVQSLKLLLDHYLSGGPRYRFDYSLIRPAGAPLKTFGGIAPGPEPLKKLHEAVTQVLDARAGQYVGITAITDIMNLIGVCVVSGNVRRSSEIVLGPANSLEFLNLKNYEVNKDRAAWGWASNNSVKATIGMDYGPIAEKMAINGEPGLIWMENVRKYGRMNGKEESERDKRAEGTNPW